MQATLVIKSRLGPCEHPTIKSKSITSDSFRTLMFTPFTTSSFIFYVTWLRLPCFLLLITLSLPVVAPLPLEVLPIPRRVDLPTFWLIPTAQGPIFFQYNPLQHHDQCHYPFDDTHNRWWRPPIDQLV